MRARPRCKASRVPIRNVRAHVFSSDVIPVLVGSRRIRDPQRGSLSAAPLDLAGHCSPLYRGCSRLPAFPLVVRSLQGTQPVQAAPAPAPAAETKARKSLPKPPKDLEGTRKRAEVGDPYEQAALATRYATGEDVPQDYSMAVRWYLKAAEQGHVSAQDALGSYFWMGRGVPKDVTKAYFWSVLARAEGKETSKVRVALMTAQLTRAQSVAIQQEANRFLRQHPPLLHSDSTIDRAELRATSYELHPNT